MPRRPSAHPTEAELEILNVLWRRGPSTVRDSVGMVIDIYVDPVRRHEPNDARTFAGLLRAVDRRADLLDASRILEEAALDKYIFQRDAYVSIDLHNRKYTVIRKGTGKPWFPGLPPIDREEKSFGEGDDLEAEGTWKWKSDSSTFVSDYGNSITIPGPGVDKAAPVWSYR